MPFAWTRRLALGGLLSTLAACSTSHDNGAAPSARLDAGAADSATPASVAIHVPTPEQCGGDPASACAGPSTDVVLTIESSAPSVTLSLEGEYGDTTLSGDVVPMENGSALVTLHTASIATTFTLLARATNDPAATASIAVAVSSSGFAKVRVNATYTGHRWTSQSKMWAVVTTSAACAALAKAPLPDGDGWELTSADVPLQPAVPAGAALAADVRVGHFAYGCVDIPPLVASPTPHDVAITVYDLPIALAQANLDASFAFTSDATATKAWGDALGAAGQRVAATFFATGNDGKALLDAVRATIASASDQADFDQQRTKNGWDATATTWLGKPEHLPSMHDRAVKWLGGTTTAALGPLGVHLAGGTTTGTAAITIASFGALSAASAGLTPPSPFAWSADPDDTVHLSGAIDFAMNPYVARLADAPSAVDVPQAIDVPSALALAIDASGLAQLLVGAGSLYGSCAASCTADAFRTAIAATWAASSAAAANDGDAARFTLTASAPASVGDHAEPLGFSGAWLGQASGGGIATTFALKGSVSAQTTSIPTH